MSESFQIGDKVKGSRPEDDKRWVGVVLEVASVRTKIRLASDKKGKDAFWVMNEAIRKYEKR
jgi:hypothetical protein